ncbi:ribosomal protein S18-alanine N-acetyltransferase [Streptomyces sp. TRM76323]|uniref:Ribosomal protein S18-alanine N-acetyltransferase n=1 Tax=Streptomyces tamarix TaxID=3078565 RepID=A0ABU3QG91_9ACTN|nr:ribosomal protein S18-alanine N-acetyltransferase [Streptomyces tamarix]MDT9681781.1 ribosomal protein S18-alanine N-acetyltransferase [Streptomyces tamarix]
MRWWDIAPVLDLERELFPEDAWSEGMFWSELAHARGPRSTRRYVVAEESGAGGAGADSGTGGGGGTGARIVGYAGLAAVGGLGDVQTIAVARDHWGTGLGARLLTELLHHATAFECEEVLLEVRVDNTRAQKLYERFGFEPIGFRRGYYQPGNVDALVMRLTVQDATGTPGPAGLPGTATEPAELPEPAELSEPAELPQSTEPTETTESAETHG